MSSEITFYNYFYLDPRKPGRFVYEEMPCSFLYEPILVGKGCNDRYIQTEKSRNRFFSNVAKKIEQQGHNLKKYVIKINEDITDELAFSFEKNYIKIIGRRDLRSGPLLNLTDGGEGSSGYKHTEESKAKMRCHRIKPFSDEFRKERQKRMTGSNNPMWGKHRTDDVKLKLRLANLGKIIPKEIIEKIVVKNKDRKRSLLTIQKLRQKFGHWWKLISPNNQEYVIQGLSQVRIYGLNPTTMWRVAKQLYPDFKGWKMEKLNET